MTPDLLYTQISLLALSKTFCTIYTAYTINASIFKMNK